MALPAAKLPRFLVAASRGGGEAQEKGGEFTWFTVSIHAWGVVGTRAHAILQLHGQDIAPHPGFGEGHLHAFWSGLDVEDRLGLGLGLLELARKQRSRRAHAFWPRQSACSAVCIAEPKSYSFITRQVFW